MTRRASRGWLVWTERAFFAFGIGCLAWLGLATLEASLYQQEQAAKLETLLEAPPGAVAPVPADAPAPALELGHLVGMLEIPRLRVATPVVHGDDDRTLDLAVGHLPDTPAPWDPGNSAVAAHRDGLFRPLKGIKVGDRVVMTTPRGELEYVVRELKIVVPEDLSVLAPRDGEHATLTLITCYPFNYVGSAPKRFIVHAERVDRPAAAAGGFQ